MIADDKSVPFNLKSNVDFPPEVVGVKWISVTIGFTLVTTQDV